MIESEWQSYISRKAWENISKNFGEQVLNAFMGFAEGLTGAEIAAKMDMAENTVYVYKLRVQKALHKEMMRLEYELG